MEKLMRKLIDGLRHIEDELEPIVIEEWVRHEDGGPRTEYQRLVNLASDSLDDAIRALASAEKVRTGGNPDQPPTQAFHA